jgi:hypothetical protein
MGEDQALSQLQAIVARPEFQAEDSVPWWAQLLGPVLDLIWSLLSRLAQTMLDTASGREGLVGLGVLSVCLVMVAGTVVYLVRAVRLAVLADHRLRATSLLERRDRSNHLWRRAQQVAAAGKFEEAIRLAYLSALYALDEQALLRVESGLTNREHALRLRARNVSLSADFVSLVDDYDRLRYGRAAIDSVTFATFSHRVEHIRGAEPGPATGARRVSEEEQSALV